MEIPYIFLSFILVFKKFEKFKKNMNRKKDWSDSPRVRARVRVPLNLVHSFEAKIDAKSTFVNGTATFTVAMAMGKTA